MKYINNQKVLSLGLSMSLASGGFASCLNLPINASAGSDTTVGSSGVPISSIGASAGSDTTVGSSRVPTSSIGASVTRGSVVASDEDKELITVVDTAVKALEDQIKSQAKTSLEARIKQILDTQKSRQAAVKEYESEIQKEIEQYKKRQPKSYQLQYNKISKRHRNKIF